MSKWSVTSFIQRLQVRRSRAQACSWLLEQQEAPTRINTADFIRWLNASPMHAELYLLERQADDHLADLFKELKGSIDIDALVDGARNEVRSARLRWRIFWIAAGTVGLLAVCLSLPPIAEQVARRAQHLVCSPGPSQIHTDSSVSRTYAGQARKDTP